MEKLSSASTVLLIAGALVAVLGNMGAGRAPAYTPNISSDTGSDGAEFEAGQCDDAESNGSGDLDFTDAAPDCSDTKGHVQDDAGGLGTYNLAANGAPSIAGHSPHPSGVVAFAYPLPL